jgi:uncharacterized spore protein YtfJ
MSMERLFEVLEGLRSSASVDAAFGQPQEAQGRILIPVSSVATGMGMGFGQEAPQGPAGASASGDEPGEGAGGGGGSYSRPIAVIEVTPEGTIVRPIADETKLGLAGIVLGGLIVFWLLVTIRAIFGAPKRGSKAE